MSIIDIPPWVVRYAHESLCRRLGEAAADMATLSEARGYEHGERYAEPVARFERNRELLEAIGWSSNEAQEPATISGRVHRAILRQALHAQLELELCMAEENPSLVGSKEQIDGAKRRAKEIEQFLSQLRRAT